MLNMDFSRAVTIDTGSMAWVPSPKSGVWRKPLAREEAERGHATSIVRYDPGASFHGHNHPLGEEILVLDGTFSDETGDFRAGTYFRNPSGFIHAPFSRDGCLILVKLHQFQPDDRSRLAIETDKCAWQEPQPGMQTLLLHEFGTERVSLLRLAAGQSSAAQAYPHGLEVFVLEGEVRDADGVYPAGTWLRRPPGSRHGAVATRDSLLWIKSGHLP